MESMVIALSNGAKNLNNMYSKNIIIIHNHLITRINIFSKKYP